MGKPQIETVKDARSRILGIRFPNTNDVSKSYRNPGRRVTPLIAHGLKDTMKDEERVKLAKAWCQKHRRSGVFPISEDQFEELEKILYYEDEESIINQEKRSTT